MIFIIQDITTIQQMILLHYKYIHVTQTMCSRMALQTLPPYSADFDTIVLMFSVCSEVSRNHGGL